MGKCVCVTMEEVRKCHANCDIEPRKKSLKSKEKMSKAYSIRYNETITAVHNYIQLMDVLKDAAQGHIVEIRISDAIPEAMQKAIIAHNDVVKSKNKS